MELINKYYNSFGHVGILGIAIILISYQILKLRTHLIKDAEIEELRKR